MTLKKMENVTESRNEITSSSMKLKDVLFINGCTLPQTTRYRIENQREQLAYENITSEAVFFDKLSLDLVKGFKMFIFYRCPYTESVSGFIKIAQKMNKAVLYDIDELVIDGEYTKSIKYLDTMSEEERNLYDDGVVRNMQTLKLCDGAITVTETLAKELKKVVNEVYVNRNVASDRLVKLSKLENYYQDGLIKSDPQYLADEQKVILEKVKKEISEREGKIRLGYFSGSITHNDDILMITPTLIRLMDEYDNLEMFFVGEITVPKAFDQFNGRVKIYGFTDWEQLPSMISSVDINLAPLEDTTYNQAKSEVRWIESSLVKVPMIASNVGAYKRMIEDHETGILCNNTEDWYGAIKELIDNETLRQKISENACLVVSQKCVTYSNSRSFCKYIKETYLNKTLKNEIETIEELNAQKIIDVRNVGIRFTMSSDKILSLKEWVTALLSNKVKMNEYWALKDVSFSVAKGDVLGIVGRNGAGKSTLLKIISGIVGSTKGSVTVNGNIVPMLELGSGFDFDLTGRENVYLNGAILGYSKSFLKEKFDDIHEFSELGEFIDMPIRNYSSGMLMRLAFSIATVVEPEILIVDEILAVGDENFQRKSKKRMLELMSGGTTVLFVSHSMDQIREMCNKVVWIEKGVVKMFGDTETVCDAYSI
ncbi:ATP-binding cassette domain-containing protein [Beduini massiliensis]|uniref:ATP-binding cassette domain-containing protein n=1 Tax=Beduini massiliensis TaxID=1585974 RepID=UPI0009E3342C|nr:ATP-binding cassette domain-containing protein [Beduini massiliensis]